MMPLKMPHNNKELYTVYLEVCKAGKESIEAKRKYIEARKRYKQLCVKYDNLQKEESKR